jgi:hypothetical protein
MLSLEGFAKWTEYKILSWACHQGWSLVASFHHVNYLSLESYLVLDGKPIFRALINIKKL